jgi:hypothetical protein
MLEVRPLHWSGAAALAVLTAAGNREIDMHGRLMTALLLTLAALAWPSPRACAAGGGPATPAPGVLQAPLPCGLGAGTAAARTTGIAALVLDTAKPVLPPTVPAAGAAAPGTAPAAHLSDDGRTGATHRSALPVPLGAGAVAASESAGRPGRGCARGPGPATLCNPPPDPA